MESFAPLKLVKENDENKDMSYDSDLSVTEKELTEEELIVKLNPYQF
jgi:hypothetical protein